MISWFMDGSLITWKITEQLLDTSQEPHELRLTLSGERGAEYLCPVCGTLCKAHDFKEFTWRHLNFLQHRCYITAAVPRVCCPEHGVNVPRCLGQEKVASLLSFSNRLP
ncbi:MAG TPA: transposase family protein [Phycisphaerales bacterium]|nr:transposase family protein [Phycisphaerales bacterium]